MKLSRGKLLELRDNAIKKYLDNPTHTWEDVTKAWIESLEDTVRSMGYEIYVKKIGDDSSDTNERIEL